MTRTQSKSPCWKEHRKGRLTASKHDVFTKVNTLAKPKGSYFPRVTPLVADLIYQDNNLVHIEAIKWGHDHEEDAAKAFYALEATKHLDFKVEPAGLFVDKTRAYIGASPDKIMKSTCHGKSVVGIKCPHKIWDKTIKDNFKDLDFLTLITDGNISMNKKHKCSKVLVDEKEISKNEHPRSICCDRYSLWYHFKC